MTAALFHALNHTLFKSLLFFGAGAVLTATGSRDMSRLGGLLNRMPRDGPVRAGRLDGDFGVAAAQRLRLGMADPAGRAAGLAISAVDAETAGARGRRLDRADGGAGGGLLRSAFGISFLGRPRRSAGDRARRSTAFR